MRSLFNQIPVNTTSLTFFSLSFVEMKELLQLVGLIAMIVYNIVATIKKNNDK